MLLGQIFEATQSKTAVLGWGRGMGHKGHMLLAKAVLHHAKENNAKPYFVVSRTSLVDPNTGQPWTDKPTFTKTKDDPLTPDEKLATYRKVFPQNAEVFTVATADATKLEQVIAKIAREGFNKVILVVGEDQKQSMAYLTRPDKSGVPPYKQAGLADLEIISRQDTTEPSSMRGSPEYQEGPRATPMRQVLLDPSKSEEEQFAVWRRDMPDNLSDEEVMDLMRKAKQRMSMVPQAKRKVAERQINELFDSMQEYFKLSDGQVIRVDYRQAGLNADAMPGSIKIVAVDPKLMPMSGMQIIQPWDKARQNIRTAIQKWVQAGQANNNGVNELDQKSKKTWADYGMPSDKDKTPQEKHYHGWEEYKKEQEKKKEQQKQVPLSEDLEFKISKLVRILENKNFK